MTTITLKLENYAFNALKRYAEEKKMSIQDVLQTFVNQLSFDKSEADESEAPSWAKPLPQAIIDIMPERKMVSFDNYEDYRAELEKQLNEEL